MNKPLSVTQYTQYYKKKYGKTITRAGVIDHIRRGNLDAVRYGNSYFIFNKKIKKQKKGRPKNVK